MKRLFTGALALLMVLTLFAGCGKEEAATETVTAETAEPALEAIIADYLGKLRSGAYDSERLFDYEDFSAYFTLGAYKGLSYPEDDYLRTEATDQEVESYLVVAVMNGVVTDEQYTLLTEGEVQRYDVAHLVYEGSFDGVPQDSATTGPEGVDLIIGSGSYITGFEEGLIGSAIGGTVTLDLALSPYYGNEDLAGKKIRFNVTVEQVRRPALPEITAETINQIYGTDFPDMETVRSALKEELNADRAAQAQSSLDSYLQAKILAGSKLISYPEKEMAHYRAYFETYIRQYADAQQQSLEDYLAGQGFTPEEFEEKKEEYARSSCEMDLMIFSIVRAEKIEATDEQISALMEGICANVQGDASPRETIDRYMENYGPFYFENRIKSAAAMELVRKSAVRENA